MNQLKSFFNVQSEEEVTNCLLTAGLITSVIFIGVLVTKVVGYAL